MLAAFRRFNFARGLLAGTFLGLVVGCVGGASALVQHTPSPATFYACLANGSLSKVGTTASTCVTGRLISWNAQGPSGPQGPAGPQANSSCLIQAQGISNLAGCDLTGVNLLGVNMLHWNFRGSNLFGANMSEIGGQYTNFQDAILTNASFRAAHLEGANLRGANLSGAVLTWANLTDADLTGANLAGVTWGYTTCPNGHQNPANTPC